MRTIYISIICLLCGLMAYGQKQNIYQLPIPRDLDDCFEVLDQTYSDETIKIMMDLSEDSVYGFVLESDEVNLVAVWKLDKNSVLARYFYRHGLEQVMEMHECILISYYRYLNGIPIEFKEQVAEYKVKRIEAEARFLAQLKADTVRGVYIPQDLPDCFRVLNQTLSPEEIMIISDLPSRDAITKYLPHVCIWLRDAWLLNEPTRLQLYMIEHGVEKPLFMAVVIMRFYYDSLHQDDVAWHKFDKRK